LSETPKRKRLTDEGALMFWEAPTSSDLHALKRDHLQAREDRKRLAEALGHMRWCRSCADGSWADCEEGRAAEALLVEVSP
jgi:hypothetical protein